MSRVFISYAREDSAMARRLYGDLAASGHTPWLDSENLLPGERWRRAIQLAIKESDYFLALLSSSSVSKRGFVQKEVLAAIEVL